MQDTFGEDLPDLPDTYQPDDSVDKLNIRELSLEAEDKRKNELSYLLRQCALRRYKLPYRDVNMDETEFASLCQRIIPPKIEDYPLPLSRYNYIDGPECLHILRKGDINILLFGEIHLFLTHMERSIPTQFYIEKLIQRYPKAFFDLYTEEKTQEFIEEKSIRLGTDFNKLCHLTKNFTKDACFHKRERNIRLHAIDIRDDIQDPLKSFSSLYENSRSRIISRIEQEIKDAKDIKNSLILNSIRNIRDQDIKESLLSLYDEQFSKEGIIAKYQYLLDRIKSDAYADEIQMEWEVFKTPSLELYALARMFTTYKSPPFEARNIIFYAGNNHTTAILSFLMNVGFEVLYTDCNNIAGFIDTPPLDLLDDIFL